ncbi:Uncharacterized conserved protein, DUF2249 family [Raineyella antarctica]|uniref:Uncharacterized conserved protein, DUF2249 family n=1 Tax=Raineyella antarctica TaxID=1577474 RepID=A0A1G6GH06_9ACTN|nr:DUF2249 domain-containing protein [Raineyella antarctica]SDB81234.1 Uncharacterized conserved protein, DUF2249 family [Raineyella antarctica]
MSQSTACQCGHEHDTTIPSINVLDIPHAVRHGAVIGAITQLSEGGALDVVAPHNPLPMMAQLEDVAPGQFAHSYVTEGPEQWTVRFTRN